MAGAGYDVSASTSRALASGAQSSSPVIINFSGGSVDGANSDQTNRPNADATATNRSPGAANSFSDLTPQGQSQIQSGKSSGNNNVIIYALAAVVVILLLKK